MLELHVQMYVLASGVYSERQYTCSLSPSSALECNTHTINVESREYTKVCGRVRAYMELVSQVHSMGML